SALLARRLSDWDPAVACQFGFANGATASISAVLATPQCIRCRVFGTEAWVEVVNDAHPDSPEGKAHLTLQRTGSPPETTTFSWTDTVRANLEEFARAIEGSGKYRFTPGEILHNIEVLEAVTVAARTCQTVRLRSQPISVWAK